MFAAAFFILRIKMYEGLVDLPATLPALPAFLPSLFAAEEKRPPGNNDRLPRPIIPKGKGK